MRNQPPNDDPFPDPGAAAWAGPSHGLPVAQVGPDAGAWEGQASLVETDLREYIRLAWARRWLILAIVTVTVLLGSAWGLTRPKIYATSSTISINSRTPDIIRNQISFGPSLWELERYVSEQKRVLKSLDLAQRVADRLGAEPGEDGLATISAEELLGLLRVDPEPETSIVNLSMRGTNPEQITEWLNLYVDEYVEYNIESSLQRMNKIYEVILDKLEPLRDQLELSEERLTTFKEQQGTLFSADQEKNVISEQVNTLTTEYAQAKAERIRLETKINALEQIRTQNLPIASFPEILNDSTIRSLRQQRDAQEVELQEKLKTYRDGHPAIKDLRERADAIEQRILKQIETIITGLRTDYEMSRRREQTLFASIQQLKGQTIELSKQVLEYEKLRRDYEQNNQFYGQMMARSKEADISGSVSTNNIRIIDKARVPRGPFSPNVPRTVLMSLVLGCFFGIGLVFGLDFLDQSLRTPDDVERHLGLETFALVPSSTSQKKKQQRASLEVYQGLRTALMFAARDTTCQILMVTSAGPREGKTTTAFNCAKVLAAARSRVLLVDADLRKPKLHRMAGVSSRPGLTSVVLGERGMDETVHTFDGYPTLHILTAGPLPPNPPELFGKVTFERLLEHAQTRYDWVIIDSPPVVSVTDAVLCSKLVDMVLLVIEYGRLERKVVRAAFRQLAWAGARVVGAVLNRVDFERSHYYYDSYYSYYHSPYSYEQENESENPASA